MKGGDGGNTQFYETATAANARFENVGGTTGGANGGDVAFDGTSTAAAGIFHNYAASADGGYGGVTSFNNNYPSMAADEGADAGHGTFVNYGASTAGAGGGHTFFTGKYGSGNGRNGTFVNYGSSVSGNSTAGHTVFSVSIPESTPYKPTAGEGTYWNHPGTASGAAGGYTEFTVYQNEDQNENGSDSKPQDGNNVPSPGAAKGTFISLGATVEGANGGVTKFDQTCSAEEATLIACGGVFEHTGGQIVFQKHACGGSSAIRLEGNGTLDISYSYRESLSVGSLSCCGGVIKTSVGQYSTELIATESLTLQASPLTFAFSCDDDCDLEKEFPILKAPNLPQYTADDFRGNSLNGYTPRFVIGDDETLFVIFEQQS